MRAFDLLYSAKQNGIDIALNEEQLQLKLPRNKDIDKNLIDEIRNNKELIIDFLKNHQRVNGSYNKINRFDRDAVGNIPLSFSQERLWFIDKMEGSVQYHIPVVLRLKGYLNRRALSFAFETVVHRHEVLRTVILDNDGKPYQHIKERNEWKLAIIGGNEYLHDPLVLQKCIEKLIKQPFDLSKDDMLRAHLITLGELEHTLVVTMHHIASDGLSLSIFLKELAELYVSWVEDRPAQLQPLDIQYADFALWQRQYLQGETLDKKVEYWKEKLSGVTPLHLATDFPRHADNSMNGASCEFRLDKKLSEELLKLSEQQGATLFMTLLAAFKVLLYRYTSQGDICVGTPIAGRLQQEVEGLIGFFVNTLALRSEVNGDVSFVELLEQVRTTSLEAYEHQDVPFEKVVNAVVKERDSSQSPLFQVMFVFQNTPEIPKLRLGEVQLFKENYEHTTAKFDLTFGLTETLNGLQVFVKYRVDLFSARAMERMLGHYKELLSSIVSSPGQKIGVLPMLILHEEHQLLYEFTNTTVSYPKGKTIVHLFEEQAANTPDNIAVVFENEQLTYTQLNERSNQLGHYLKSRGVKEETLVPICIGRSIEMIVAILGVLKAGGAYVPIDPQYPWERIDYVLKDTGANLIICSKESRSKIQTTEDIAIIEIDNESLSLIRQPTGNVQNNLAPHHLVYIIYTSGSTGKPKGVMIEHQALLDHCYGFINSANLKICSSFALFSPLVFDAGHDIIFGSILLGASLHVLSNRLIMDGERLISYINDRAIDCIKFVPSVWLSYADTKNVVLPKKVLIFGGEPIPLSIIDHLVKSKYNGDIYNHYGPTETTIGKCIYKIDLSKPYIIVPVGKPYSNTRLYIIDKSAQLVPIGVAGEICIGGEGLARGYLNLPELTAGKFVPDPFHQLGGTRMYRTGDIGRWLENGNIECFGRNDDQVKISGHRVEPGEIENVLLQNEHVRQAIVIAKEDVIGNKRLVGYLITDQPFDREAIVAYLKSMLPDYMIPVLWVEMEKFPLTFNGKIDRKALPDPNPASGISNAYIAPGSEAERLLAEIWEELLPLNNISINDNFFELGGHSLLAIRVISLIRKRLKVELMIKDLFVFPTIAELAMHLQAQSEEVLSPSIEVQPRTERIPLSFSQERLWFIDSLNGSIQYHIPHVFRISKGLDTNALTYALQMIVNRHEVLRTVIQEEEGEGYQYIKGKDRWQLTIIDGYKYEGYEELKLYIKQLINKPFDLSIDHLLRADLIRLDEQDHVLVVTLHHIASDAWSRAILVEELVELYKSYTQDQQVQLAPLERQYADYAIWQRRYLQGELLDKKISYWKEKLQGAAPLQLPTDYSRPGVQSIRGSIAHFSIDKELSKQLKMLSQRQNTTVFMTLLAVFKVLLNRYSGQQDICIGSPIAGRQYHEVEKNIGFFVNTLALRSEVNGEDSFTELLQKVRATTLEAYEHQDVPFEKVVNAVVKERDMSRNPLFQVMLVYQNTPEVPEVRLGEIILSDEKFRHDTAKFDITFFITETAYGLEGGIEYSTDLYKEETITRMAGHYKELISSIVKQPKQKISKLSLLTDTEEQQLLVEFNNTEVSYPKDKTVVDLFEEQVAMAPENIAVLFEKDQLTYGELNKKANQLARHLRSKGVKEETLVPICIERGLNMIVGILAILKAGGAYVPIDPEYPQDRINYMMEDTAANIILSSKENRVKLPLKEGVEVIEIDGDWTNISKQAADNLQTTRSTDTLLYIIYTSGSTGKPKGVRMPERGLVNLLTWQQKQFENKLRRVLQFASLNFDVSFQDIFSTLCFGSSLYLIAADRRIDMTEVIKDIRENKITHLFIPFIVLKNLAEYLLPLYDDSFPLEEIIVAGEQLKLSEDIRSLVKKSRIRIINQYGPTETHVVSSYTIGPDSDLPTLPPIGKPIDNSRLYVLDTSGELAPIGIAGELYIGGVQVAGGYLNKPALTSEKFIADKFSKDASAKLYKTGDIARWLPDGNLDYLGRIDDQIKIRGYRIEPGEIESVLQECPMVRQGVVLAKEDSSGNKRLVGYIVPEGEFNREVLMSFLKKKLPDYMVPALWIKTEHLPLTSNGKINRGALPDPEVSELLSAQYVAPESEAEKALSEIWKELLKIESIGTKDNFFELGGHSMLVLQIVNRVRKLGYEIQAKDLFKYQTIEQQSKFISTSLKLIDAAREGKYVIPIHAKGNNIPFFAIPEYLLYYRIGNHISKEQPFYAIEPSSYTKVEDVVAEYISEIRKIYPKGPYCIAGYCQWGRIAVEIAHALVEQGEEVPLLVLIEYYSVKARKSRASFSFIRSKIKSVYNRLKSSSSFRSKREIFTKELYYTFYYILKKQFLINKKTRHINKQYGGKVVLIQASETYSTKEDPHMGWSEVFIGEVEKFTIDGEHLGIFFEPGASKIAEKLNLVLEKINRSYKSNKVNNSVHNENVT